jgi:hypothetical protein
MQRGILLMSHTPGAEYAELLREYRELVDGVRMIRRAVDRAFRTGVLPSVEQSGLTPVQECEAVARAIYGAAVKHYERGGLPMGIARSENPAGRRHDPC